MKYYLDIGNTNTTIYFENNKINLKTVKDESMYFYLKEHLTNLSTSSLFVVSVVPELDLVLDRLKSNVGEYSRLEPHHYDLLMNFNGPDSSQMGADRVILDVFVNDKMANNSIIVDMGTAITVDVLKNGTYISGYIYPGFATSLKALIGNASLLENIEYKDINEANICVTSESQINDGLIIGTVGSINNLVIQSLKHFDFNVEIIITGGYFNLLNEILDSSKLNSILQFDYTYKKELMYEAMIYMESRLAEL